MSSQIDTSTGAAAAPVATLQALAVAGEQSGWHVLDTARAQQFTGEIVFQTQPTISVYFDNGLAYYAVKAGDPSLCDRLVELGVVEATQLERGVIRVGNVENLGRLFDRDPSVDRDAVMVVLEIATDEVVTAIANTVTSSFTSTAYRHHVSGVHRWFVAPSDQGRYTLAQLAPIGEVAQIDASVTSDLPGLNGLSTVFDDGVQIEWDQPLGDELPQPPAAKHSIDDSMLQSILESDHPSAPATPDVSPDAAVDSSPPIAPDADSDFEADEPTALAPPAPAPAPAPSPDEAEMATEPEPSGDGTSAVLSCEPDDVVATPVDHVGADKASEMSPDDFQIVWPDGSEQALLGTGVKIVGETPETDAVTPSADPDESPAATPVAEAHDSAPSIDSVPVDIQPVNMPIIIPADEVSVPEPEPTREPTPEPSLTFELPALAVADNNVPADHQPEEVVDAVRRALEAIEAASAAPTRLPSVAIVDLPSFEPAAPLQFDVVDPLVVEPRSTDAPENAAPIETASPATASPADVLGQVAEPVAEPVIEQVAEQVIEPVISSAEEPASQPAARSALESALPPQVDEMAPVASAATPLTQVAEPTPAPFGGFAPPTAFDSAEAVYARAAEEDAPAGPVAGVASVVFVDEDPEEDDDRSSALKRLIGSLRRK